MRTDPRKACANEREKFLWAFVHDLVAHGTMALSMWSGWSLRLHDWTSKKAWSRPAAEYPKRPVFLFSSERFSLVVQEISAGRWKVKHPKVNHEVVLTATHEFDAAIQAKAWFDELGREFGGRFVINKEDLA